MSDYNEKVDLTEQVEDSKISFQELSKKNNPTKLDRIVTIVLLLICVALAAYVLFGSSPTREIAAAEEEYSTSINVRTETAESGLFRSYTRLNGSIGSDNADIAIVPDTTGTVESILVTRGDIVEENQVIAYINPSRPGLNYKSSPVKSKIRGVITSIPVSVGETVSTSSSIATVTGDKTLHIETSLPERYLGTVQEGMLADFTSVAYPNETFTGEITYIAPYVKSTNRTADIEIAITSGDDVLKEGMFVTVDLVTEELDDVITVPTDAISEVSDQSFVYVVENGQASRRNVTVGSNNGDRTVITAGLNEGDVVIVAGTVADGSTVNVLE